MTLRTLSTVLAVAALTTLVSAFAAEKPLKVYILAGQSNMQGQAKPQTIAAMKNDADATELYQAMTDKDGKPITVEDTYIIYEDRSGKLNATFGTNWKGAVKLGPEYTFGIYLQKHLNEPILLIKTAWGGKNLHTDFRPPSAEPGKGAGEYYQKMITDAKAALTKIKSAYPEYNEKAGYKIEGFVWFQGFNDMIDGKTYPNRLKSGGFQKYTDYLCHFIRDVRKDFEAPEMKFVIGCVGQEGVDATNVSGIPRKHGENVALQRAQAAPASMPEFKGNVAAVYTAKCWDHELGAAQSRLKFVGRKVWGRTKGKKVTREEKAAIRTKLEMELLTEEQRELAKGISDGGYHYLGSAKIYGRIGKAFADAMVELDKTQ